MVGYLALKSQLQAVRYSKHVQRIETTIENRSCCWSSPMDIWCCFSKGFVEGVNQMEFSIRGLLALLLSAAWVDTSSAGTNNGRPAAPRGGKINRIATKTAELVAMQIVIILCAVILLGSVTRARVMFGPSEHL